jgi:uncharacterized membrane protein YhaH (DUF805 family)
MQYIVKRPDGRGLASTCSHEELRREVTSGKIPRDWIARRSNEPTWYRVGAFLGLVSAAAVQLPSPTPPPPPPVFPKGRSRWYHFFTWQGRISRSSWWIGLSIIVVLGGLWQLLIFIAEETSSGVARAFPVAYGIAMNALFALLVWLLLMLHARRWHDRNKPGAMALIGFIPVIGQIWLLVELGLLQGSTGPNRYGNDPLKAAGNKPEL